MDICVRPVWAEIDLDIIANNMKEIRNLVGEKEIIAVVKANAYGHLLPLKSILETHPFSILQLL